MESQTVTKPDIAPGETPTETRKKGPLRRFAPVIVIVALMIAAWATGLHEYLSLNALARNREALDNFVHENIALSVLAFSAIYILAVVLSLPGATILTLAGGLLFGWFWGGTIAVLAATTGALGVFLVARTALGEVLLRKTGPWLDKLAKGFREDAFSYMLFLRLAPVFPFWLVNLAPAALGVPTMTYFLATLVGIIPGTFTYAVVGAGLGSVIEAQAAGCENAETCSFDLSLSSLLTGEIIAAFVLLAALALVPPIARRFLRRGDKAAREAG
ncbi:TVP38/TMEM64 family protein [Tepidamorphus sp. 3E244]|uniref:TVP38/TMEM64 family protein n=1 Tax=Tepidamorphus sp. 3E244 TaxID=3385498 RepID=UPI0038FCF50D